MVDGGYRMMESEDGEGADERMSDPSGRMVSHSPSVSSPRPTRPPTNSVHEKSWGQTHAHWHGLINDEHRQLLGTEEDSSERHSSDDEDYDVWTINEEQRQYYTEQFRSMQSDLTALLSGTAAKEFFEKSKLPVNELSKIWQLADVTRDGALSLEEFFTAMHLVVLRRNNIELPESLPPSLFPQMQRKSSSSGVEGGNSGASGNSSVVAHTIVADIETTAKATPDPLSPSRNKEVCAWTKFVDSPTSTLSSPGLKPVNFDFQKSAVEQDPKILHPKAVRLTPESKRLDVTEGDGPASFSPDPALTSTDITSTMAAGELQPSQPAASSAPGPTQASPKKNQEGQEIKPIQRPLPRKPAGCSISSYPHPISLLPTPPFITPKSTLTVLPSTVSSTIYYLIYHLIVLISSIQSKLSYLPSTNLIYHSTVHLYHLLISPPYYLYLILVSYLLLSSTFHPPFTLPSPAPIPLLPHPPLHHIKIYPHRLPSTNLIYYLLVSSTIY
ncbi:RalBP1-associated Eps domain-containing protein 2 [Penaeus vannamei]|uniref:RalBP1-associated Eps domain-containing protein 2 n=1 Tax=Penaeus vannamei TaxID=6689 RepID=A0A3R7PQ68_PENVA|nr:RalBP1-associated Eps domain-containing protein 2 [Penaeus vannamei]